MAELVERDVYGAEAPIALIVGCGDMGMGAARTLGRRHPLLVIDIDGERLEAAIALLRHEGYSASGRRCDISDPEQTGALGDALGKGPGVRVLAHVAAVAQSIGSWRKMMAVDLGGPHLIAEAVGPHMVRGGAAIFISSLASYLSPPDPRLEAVLDDPLNPGFYDALVGVLGYEPSLDETYNHAKQGVNRLAEKLAVAWGPRGARALSLSPGMIHTSIARKDGGMLPAHDGTEGKITRNDKAREIPLGRQGTILEITSVIDFLASDAASFLNGIDITVDGGHRAAWRRRGVIKR